MYTIGYSNTSTHEIELQYTFTALKANTEVFLPAWRPGRYEVQNFAKNVLRVEAFDGYTPIGIVKKAKDVWKLENSEGLEITIRYSYFANQMDAGGTYLDDEQLYINFVTCMLCEQGAENLPCEVQLSIPDDYHIACGLRNGGKHQLRASSYYELVDSPLIASATIQKLSYEVQGSTFNLWFQGDISLTQFSLIDDFKKFTESNIEVFGEFPCPEYHFLFQILPYKYYHGVEHRNSTVIVLGPDYDFYKKEFINNLLGVSCHELFHTWNVIRLRPAEMTPYNFSQENYFNTGYVIEGITTYYGELLLARSGVFGTEQFFKEMNTLFRNHFDNFGHLNASLADSSVDAWLDGYQPNSLNRRVSIYHKGAIMAFLLDIELRKTSNNEITLDTLMRSLWLKYGANESGYLHEDFVQCTEELIGHNMDTFFRKTLFERSSLLGELKEAVQWLGCELAEKEPNSRMESYFGARTSYREGKAIVSFCQPGSPAAEWFIKEDEIIAVNGRKVENNLDDLLSLGADNSLLFFRNKKLMEATLFATGDPYFTIYQLKQTETENPNFKKWIGANN